LKPNETGCVIDEQCSRACSTSFCSRRVSPPRCVCQTGYHYLFGKCWSECPPFASKTEPLMAEEPDAIQCVPNRDELTEELIAQSGELAKRERRRLRRHPNDYC